MTLLAIASEPACPGSADDLDPASGGGRLTVERRPFSSIDPVLWDRLAASSSWATPFSAWAFHRAWWDAYGENAHDETTVVVPAGAGGGAAAGASSAEPLAIIPLMHRHEVEPTDAERHTTLRHGDGIILTPVPPNATAIFFGASYHADYATILAAPGDLPAIADALVAELRTRAAGTGPHWDALDLRRLRCGDPAADALAAAFQRAEVDPGWTVNLEREDVCPVVTLPTGGTIDDYLATLSKKERHEVRRKVRRAEAAGEVALTESRDPLVDLDAFIALHQGKWGGEGLFPATEGGAQSRVLFRRLFELFGADGALRLNFLTIGGRRVAASVHFETPDRILYYNAGVDPAARDLSPGVVMVAAMIRQALERGTTAFDFLRGDEPYKYEWGAVDEPIQRLLVRREIA